MVNDIISDLKGQQPQLIAFCTPYLELPCFGKSTLGNYRSMDTVGSVVVINTNYIMNLRSLHLDPSNQSSTTISAVNSEQYANRINSCISRG